MESVRNEMLEKKTRLQNEEPNKANNKLPNAIKPYWYIDPSIVYKAMTSPVTTQYAQIAELKHILIFNPFAFVSMSNTLTDQSIGSLNIVYIRKFVVCHLPVLLLVLRDDRQIMLSMLL